MNILKLNALLLAGILSLADKDFSWWEEFGSDYQPSWWEDEYMDLMKINAESLIVSMDTIYKINDAYLENEELIDDADYEADVLCKDSIWMEDDPFFVSVAGPHAYMDYECFWIFAWGTGSSYVPVYMWSVFTDEIISLTVSKEELEEYLERTSEAAESVRGKVKYIQENFDESEYGGIYFDRNTKEVCVYMKNENRRGEIEREGICYKEAEYSLNNLYETLQEIWQCREESGVNYIEINSVTNRLDVYTMGVSNLEKWLQESDIQCCTVLEGCVMYPEMVRNGGIAPWPLCTDTDSADIVYNVITANNSERRERIKKGIEVLKEAYPDYECRNLMIRLLLDEDYEKYLDFDEELLEFADSVPAYSANEKDPVEELLFGDPDRLEIKSRLREYKQIYPKMSYQEIYDEYLSDWEDTSIYTRESKMYDLAINRHNGKFSEAAVQVSEGNKEIAEDRKAGIEPAVFGGIILAAGVITVMIKKSKA